MKFLTSILISIFTFPSFSAPINASKLELKIYKMAVSSNLDCSNPSVVIDNGNNPSYVDFKGAPDLGSGNVADGTYPCIIIEFSDNIIVTPASNGAFCNTSIPSTQDVCRGSSAKLIDGTIVNCPGGAQENKVAMYLSRASSGTSGTDAFNPPTCGTLNCDATHGLNLGASLTVSGSSIAKFVVDTDNKVCDGDGNNGAAACPADEPTNACACESKTSCNILPPNFSFTQI